MTHVLAINGSYRDDGIVDQTVNTMAEAIKASGGSIDIVHLRDHPIEFCLNCRECMQTKGSTPGHCVLEDGMHQLIARIERADAYILASPTNLGSVTAVFKRFMERLAPYAYWPWGTLAPKLRKSGQAQKKAVVISSSSAPRFIARWAFSTHRQLRTTAKFIGATSVGAISCGLSARAPDQRLSADVREKAIVLSAKLT